MSTKKTARVLCDTDGCDSVDDSDNESVVGAVAHALKAGWQRINVPGTGHRDYCPECVKRFGWVPPPLAAEPG